SGPLISLNTDLRIVYWELQLLVRKIFVLVIAVAVLLAIALPLTRSAAPVLDLQSPATTLGQATPITVHVRDPRGVRSLAAFVEQNGARYRVWEAAPSSRVTDGTWNFTAGVNTTPQLKDGKAKLILEATSNGLLRKTAHWEREVTVVTRPPIVSVASDQHYLYLGMADLATFNVSGSWTEAGGRVGGQAFRAWPMPGGRPDFCSIFAFAWNMPSGTVPLVYASTGPGYDVTSASVCQCPETEQVAVEASNHGRVVYAAPLGIYGNCIVVAHGYGLQTIYGHLSQINVREGDMVKRGQVMGTSGQTGMAGGDHIHFGMQLDGVQ